MSGSGLREVLGAALDAGATTAVARLEQVECQEIHLQDDFVEVARTNDEATVSLRLWEGGRGWGCAVSPIGDDPRILVERAREQARFMPAGDPPILAAANGLDWANPPETPMANVTARVDQLRELAADAASRPLVRRVDLRFLQQRRTVRIADSGGFDETYRTGRATLSLRLVAASEADTTTAEMTDQAQDGDTLLATAPARVVEPCAWRCRALQRPVTVPSQNVPAVVEAEIAAQLLELFTAGVLADSVQQGRSRLSGRLGWAVATPDVDIVDDARYPGGGMHAPFDDEATPTGRRHVVEGGVLTTYLFDRATARLAHTSSTGNGWQPDPALPPQVRPTNLVIEPRATSIERLEAGCDRGIRLLQVLGVHTANEVTGDFSLGANGLLLRRGEPAGALRKITVSGNVFDVLREIEAIGDDLRFVSSKASFFGSPAIRVARLALGA
jgi:PmbA protein